MKTELDPKIIGVVLAVVLVVVGVGLYLAGRGQADRSGPQVTAKYQTGGKGPVAGWHPGMSQSNLGGSPAQALPGAQLQGSAR